MGAGGARPGPNNVIADSGNNQIEFLANSDALGLLPSTINIKIFIPIFISTFIRTTLHQN